MKNAKQWSRIYAGSYAEVGEHGTYIPQTAERVTSSTRSEERLVEIVSKKEWKIVTGECVARISRRSRGEQATTSRYHVRNTKCHDVTMIQSWKLLFRCYRKMEEIWRIRERIFLQMQIYLESRL